MGKEPGTLKYKAAHRGQIINCRCIPILIEPSLIRRITKLRPRRSWLNYLQCYAPVRWKRGMFSQYAGRFDETVIEFRLAEQLYPLSLIAMEEAPLAALLLPPFRRGCGRLYRSHRTGILNIRRNGRSSLLRVGRWISNGEAGPVFFQDRQDMFVSVAGKA